MENQNAEKQYAHSNSTKETVTIQTEDIDPNLQYYGLFKSLHLDSIVLGQHFKLAQNRQDYLYRRVQRLQTKANEFRDEIRPQKMERKKYQRRGADQINKEFICPSTKCNLSYGSETSLRMHLKLKHPEQYIGKKRGRTSHHQLDYK